MLLLKGRNFTLSSVKINPSRQPPSQGPLSYSLLASPKASRDLFSCSFPMVADIFANNCIYRSMTKKVKETQNVKTKGLISVVPNVRT